MKIAISIPQELFETAEAVADRRGCSRSELYREALAQYLRRHDTDAVTEAMDRTMEAVREADDDCSFVNEANRRTLERQPW